MKTRRLGKSNLEVSALGLGCIGLTHTYGQTVDRQETLAFIHSAVDCCS
jgi:aryl-alcohol dehydrogenase-like predicted oxidoreductase